MKRIALWLMTAASGWLALRSLRAEGEAALAVAQARRTDLKKEHSASRGELVRERGDRGRTADRPTEIPPRGWKDILIRTYRSISEDRVLALAAGVTYYVLLALFPGIAALVSIYGMVANPADIGEMLASLAGTIPKDAIDIIGGQLKFLASQDQKALGFAFFGGLLASLWSSNAAIKALIDALNVVYGEKEKRNFFKLTMLSLTFTACLILFMVLALIGIVVIPAVLEFLHLGALGGHAGDRDAGAGGGVSLRPVTRRRALALDHVGQRRRRPAVVHRLDAVLVVRQLFRQLQQDLRLARRGHRLHDVELALRHRGADGRRAERRDRAPDRQGQHHRPAQAARQARRRDGGHGGRTAGLRGTAEADTCPR